MKRHIAMLVTAMELAVILPAFVRAAVPEPQLAQQGYDLLKKYCHQCHGIQFKVPGYNVLDRKLLLAPRSKEETPYIVPGKPEQSYIWQRVAIDKDMPPKAPRPSEAEKELLKKWIQAGAAFPGLLAEGQKRTFRDETAILTAVRDHLRKTEQQDRPYQRYFTLTHLYNNAQNVTADEMRLYRAALSKLANSLSLKAAVVVPKPVDAEETVYNVDLRDLGWDEHDLWKEVLKVYPYGLKHSDAADPKIREIAQEVYNAAASDLPYLRADWFIATASRPPLYYTLLEIPAHARELERALRVDVQQDFLRDKLARAGFLTSGVSKQNRVVDRHDALHGAYWKSYDFKTNEGPGNVVQFPLGPVFQRNPYPDQAFEHAGGEIIFHLPNGLQGYLLVNQKDERINEGPIDIVKDSQETSGAPVIVAGLSCMACHKNGMIRFQDKIREGSAVAGDARVKVQRLYRDQKEMDRLLEKDENRFLRALEAATGAFLQTGGDKSRNIRDYPEPISAIARLYVKDLNLQEVAMELGIDDAKKLQGIIQGNRKLREIGLAPLLKDGAIKRETWESLKNFVSPFHDVARELELGTPFRFQ